MRILSSLLLLTLLMSAFFMVRAEDLEENKGKPPKPAKCCKKKGVCITEDDCDNKNGTAITCKKPKCDDGLICCQLSKPPPMKCCDDKGMCMKKKKDCEGGVLDCGDTGCKGRRAVCCEIPT